jgi:hypothetical protein
MRLLATSSLLHDDHMAGEKDASPHWDVCDPQRLLYVKSEMVTTKPFKENL